MTGDDAGVLIVSDRIASQLKNTSYKLLYDSSKETGHKHQHSYPCRVDGGYIQTGNRSTARQDQDFASPLTLPPLPYPDILKNTAVTTIVSGSPGVLTSGVMTSTARLPTGQIVMRQAGKTVTASSTVQVGNRQVTQQLECVSNSSLYSREVHITTYSAISYSVLLGYELEMVSVV